MKKRSIMLGSVVILAVLLVVGGTMAWFTAEAKPVVNTFKAGTVDINLIDEFPENGIENVNPGDTHSKVVRVENIGSKRAYIRVKLTPEFNPELPVDVVEYTILSDWIDGGDGWYYYKNIIQPGAATSNVIEEVKFKGREMGNEYQDATFTLTVEAEAIQATNGAINDQWGINPVDLGLEVLP
ncbi:hypothetical protein CIW83_14200 [Tissierella sp. P1]|uniref:TasA family protein n=1 Tax=Tissierella sp. P1 TaxID=1280483 RepID=UPI000BA153D5|nr:TasA family protein [Tissierella sp. P1]OZV11588.1 hypothetical protein CIW83_14200 [Tissierella sp. P1]